ncbi:hypothetical protein BurJ1DRAFT_0630 [Burkholderiales bacterium JOSHI_001]|nr:hypothetical protein BurJ1DRAFT_0630 [Burkholderiales bacterium JOSHI_001]
MNTVITAQVSSADGAPLAQGEVSVHMQRGARLVRCGSGQVKAGRLRATVDGELGPVWGLRIDGRAVLAWPLRQGDGELELQPLQLLADALALPAVHALRGQVWGLPQALAASAPAAAERADPLVRPRLMPVAMSDLVSDAATQIHLGATSNTGLVLGTANIKLSGLASKVGDVLSMQFPSTTEELAATTAITSLDLSFTPSGTTTAAPPPPPPMPTVPPVVGYTRELALRKLAAAQYTAQVRLAATASSQDAGRVLRQLPAAGQPLSAGQAVLLFVAQSAQPEPIE